MQGWPGILLQIPWKEWDKQSVYFLYIYHLPFIFSWRKTSACNIGGLSGFCMGTGPYWEVAGVIKLW